jgi:hypothetical protein
VRGYPTLLWFEKGDTKPGEFTAARTADAIVAAVNERTGLGRRVRRVSAAAATAAAAVAADATRRSHSAVASALHMADVLMIDSTSVAVADAVERVQLTCAVTWCSRDWDGELVCRGMRSAALSPCALANGQTYKLRCGLLGNLQAPDCDARCYCSRARVPNICDVCTTLYVYQAPSAVTELDGASFNSVALDPQKTVLVFFSAPWCGKCSGGEKYFITIA